MTTGSVFTWRPSDQNLALPPDTAVVWQRLTELTSETTVPGSWPPACAWPTLAEQTERAVLVDWLNPTNTGCVNDRHVFEVAAGLLNESTESSIEGPGPALAAADTVWGNLCLLATGEPVPPARPPAPDEADPYDAWRGAYNSWCEDRRAQAKDWFRTVMICLDCLVATDVVGGWELPDLVADGRLHAAMRTHVMRPVFDGPYAIGASMYFEPILPGTGFGPQGQALYVADALAIAVRHAAQALEAATTESEIRRARAHLDFLWMMLKGFLYAGANTQLGVPLPDLYFTVLAWWEDAKRSLVEGREALLTPMPEGVEPVPWYTRSRGLAARVADTTTEELIAVMESGIDDARRSSEALRKVR